MPSDMVVFGPVLTLFALTLLGHLLVFWRRPKQWLLKASDYVWLLIAGFGLFGAGVQLYHDVSIVRVAQVSQDMYPTAFSLSGTLDGIRIEACNKYVRGEFSPQDFQQEVDDYRLLCKWEMDARRKLSSMGSGGPEVQVPPVPQTKTNVLARDVSDARSQWTRYLSLAEERDTAQQFAAINQYDVDIKNKALYLLAIALSIRITKVSAELLLLRTPK